MTDPVKPHEAPKPAPAKKDEPPKPGAVVDELEKSMGAILAKVAPGTVTEIEVNGLKQKFAAVRSVVVEAEKVVADAEEDKK